MLPPPLLLLLASAGPASGWHEVVYQGTVVEPLSRMNFPYHLQLVAPVHDGALLWTVCGGSLLASRCVWVGVSALYLVQPVHMYVHAY